MAFHKGKSHHPGTHKVGHPITECSIEFCGTDPAQLPASEIISELEKFLHSIAYWMQGDQHYDVKAEVDKKILEARTLEEKIHKSVQKYRYNLRNIRA